jgi:hypothetical protein
MRIATWVRNGSAIGSPTNLATLRPIVSGKKMRKESPGNTGYAGRLRLRKADLQVPRISRPVRKEFWVLIEFVKDLVCQQLGNSLGESRV